MKRRLVFGVLPGFLAGLASADSSLWKTSRRSTHEMDPADRALAQTALRRFLELHRAWFTASGKSRTAFFGCDPDLLAEAKAGLDEILTDTPRRLRRSRDRPGLFLDPATGVVGMALDLEVVPPDPTGPKGQRTVRIADRGKGRIWISHWRKTGGRWIAVGVPEWAG